MTEAVFDARLGGKGQHGVVGTRYRNKKTGLFVPMPKGGKKICSLCGLPFANHPACDACKILVGTGHITQSSNKFRGESICPACMVRWLGIDARLGRQATWEEMLHGEVTNLPTPMEGA